MKKLLMAIFLCCLSLVLLCACNTGNLPDNNDTSGETTANQEPTDTSGEATTEGVGENVIPIVKDGKAITIIYPLDDLDAMSYAQNLAKQIKRTTGVEPTCKDDWRGFDSEADSESYEILVGDVDYPETETAKKMLGYGEAALRTVGNKICVVSTLKNDLSSAVLKLTLYITNNYDSEAKELTMPAEYHVISSTNELLSKIPQMPNITPDGFYKCTKTAYQALFDGAKQADFETYCQTVTAAGYTLYAANESTGFKDQKNRFLTYVNDTHVLTVIYLPSRSELRVMIEKKSTTSLAGLESDNVYTDGVCDTLVTQVGLLYQSGTMNGMAYVMRLSDGSFLVVDGGHNVADNATRLYEVMKKQAPDPNNIVIAAWIFTHTHGDHVGFFPHFANNYADKVTVERFIYNFPTSSQFTSDEWFDGITAIESKITSKFPNASFTNARPGQIYYIRNAKINMLYTADLYAENEIDYFNTSSIAFTVEAEGIKTMYMGDIGSTVGTLMASIYSASDLKCEVLQVAHHGIQSAPSSLYPMVAPTYVLFPLGTGPLSQHTLNGKQTLGDDYLAENQNKYFFNTDACKNNIYVANDDVVILTLKNNAVTSVVRHEDVPTYLAN